jgi:hypothetical protein
VLSKLHPLPWHAKEISRTTRAQGVCLGWLQITLMIAAADWSHEETDDPSTPTNATSTRLRSGAGMGSVEKLKILCPAYRDPSE